MDCGWRGLAAVKPDTFFFAARILMPELGLSKSALGTTTLTLPALTGTPNEPSVFDRISCPS
jgi:hypothetical protein